MVRTRHSAEWMSGSEVDVKRVIYRRGASAALTNPPGTFTASRARWDRAAGV